MIIFKTDMSATAAALGQTGGMFRGNQLNM